jgi:hypothetical protein
MTSFTLIEVQLAMALGLFLFGAISLSIGMFILLIRSAGREVRSLANQTAQLARKGMAEEVAGLVGNASALLSATNDLVRTAAGIGVFLSALGLVLMLAACWLVIRIS